MRSPARWWRLLVWVPVAIYATLVARQFFQVANSAIVLTTDDGVANIAYALATEGRYGFLSSPVLAGMARHDGLFSYGPFYFYLAAALIWLFGYNLVLIRSIHLLVMLGLAAAAGRWFGGYAWGALGALPAIGLLMAFERAQWPMVRPDSIVALSAALFVMAAGVAIRSQRAVWWLAAGLAASCGALTHLVAWSLIPAAALTFAAAVVADARDRSRSWRPATATRPLLALVAGGLVGAVAFYASFGFRVADQIAFLADYQSYTGSMAGLGDRGGTFGELLSRHFEQAYWYLPYPFAYAVWATMAAAVAVTAVAMVSRELPARRAILALVAPPAVVWAVYFGSLGVYNNFHAGYAMLNQVMWLWCGAALIGGLFEWLNAVRPRAARFAAGAVWAAALALAVGMLTVLAARTDYRALAAEAATPIDQYVDAVLAPIPARARAWGTVELGIEHPGRIQLIQFWDGIKALAGVAAERRTPLFPDYLVWGGVENAVNTGVVLSPDTAERTPDGQPMIASRRLLEAFPSPRYALASIVAGPPYGVTRVYGWTEGTPPIERPIVRIYDPRARQWNSALGAPQPLALMPAPPTRQYGGAGPSAVHTVRAELAAGTYLIEIALLPALSPTDTAIFVAGRAAELPAEIAATSSPIDVSPWFADQMAVFLLYQHVGGPFFVSQFGSGPPAIAAVEAALILPLADYRERRRTPPPETPLLAGQWSAAFPEISVTTAPGQAGAVVVGNTTQYGYQAYGPRIPVEPGQRMRLRVPVAVSAGRGCLGVLDGTELRWLLAPDGLRDEYEFQINDSRTVKPVLADCSGSPASVVPLHAVIGDGSYALWSNREVLYVDQLMEEFRRAAPR